MAGRPIYPGALSIRSAGTWNPCCSCFFSALPDELVIFEILARLGLRDLSSATQVCSRWNFLTESPSLYKDADVAVPPQSGVGLQRLLSGKLSVNTEVLKAHHIFTADVHDVSALASVRLSRLSSLDLSGSKRADAGALSQFVLAHGSTLRRLVLDGVAGLRDEHMLSILAACTGLRQLSLARCTGLTDGTLHALARSPVAARLTELNVSGCQGMTGRGLHAIIAGQPGDPRAPSHLRHLEARGIGPQGVCDHLLAALASSATCLQVLDLSHADPFGFASAAALASGNGDAQSDSGLSNRVITDIGVKLLAVQVAGLRKLRLGGWSGVSDTGVAAAVACLPSLEVLDMRGCRHVGDATAAAIVHAGLRLRELRLTHSLTLTDAGLELLCGASAGNSNASPCCKASVRPDRCTALENTALRTVHLLDVAGCRKLTLKGLAVAAAALSAKNAQCRPEMLIGSIPGVRQALQEAAASCIAPQDGLWDSDDAVNSKAALASQDPARLAVAATRTFFPARVDVRLC